MLLALSHAKASARAAFRIRGNPFGNFNCLVGEQRLFVGALSQESVGCCSNVFFFSFHISIIGESFITVVRMPGA